MFADDTVLIRLRNKGLSKLENEVSNELVTVTEWMRFNRLSLNVNKTSYIIVPCSRHKNKTNNFKLNFGRNAVQKTDTVKYLGLHLQCDVKSKSQINHICKKASQAAGTISKIRHFVVRKTLNMIYSNIEHDIQGGR